MKVFFLAKKIVKLAFIVIKIFTSIFICCVGGGGILASCGFENWLIFDRLRVRYLLEHTILHKAYNFYLLFCCKCQNSRVGTFPRKFLQFRIFTRGEIVLLSSNIAETKINFRKKPLANIFTTTQVLLQQLKIENIFQIMLLMPREGS